MGGNIEQVRQRSEAAAAAADSVAEVSFANCFLHCEDVRESRN